MEPVSADAVYILIHSLFRYGSFIIGSKTVQYCMRREWKEEYTEIDFVEGPLNHKPHGVENRCKNNISNNCCFRALIIDALK